MKHVKDILSVLVITLILPVISILLISAVGSDISVAFSSFSRGIFGSLYGFSEVLVRATPLILAALGVSVGFRTGFFNIGAEGQIYMGATAATATGLLFSGLPAILLIPLTILSGFVAGGFWSMVPGFLKAKFGLSEVINTIMFNYIAINIVGILVRSLLKNPEYPLPMSAEIPDAMKLKQFLFPTRLHTGFFIALASAAIIYILMWKTIAGYKLRAVGFNQRAAKCTGISVYKNVLLASILSGGLAGVAGACEIAGVHHKLMEGISPGFGYVAIIIALLGKNHPLGIIFSALGISALQIGSMTMQRQAGVPASISWIIMGSLVLLILGRRTLLSALDRKKEKELV
jgi:simple sugar transport system permease protein